MRIYINEGKTRMFIPLPLALLRAAVSIMQMPIVQRNLSAKDREYIEAVDWAELKKCITMLKDYKGLKVVEVKDSKGTKISITI